ncbi:MAG: nuclear transport factor 2 family protein [Flavobacteriaceae bacterium]
MTAALALARRWVNDYFNRHDAEAARDFCAPDYVLDIGDVTLAGRDETWLPAVDRQMRDYPGLTMTVHETLAGEGWAAVWFSEHGARDGAEAVWSGVAIYREDEGLLSGCVAQEDYMTRRRQLKEGRGDPVDRPCIAPWDIAAQAPDRRAESVVLNWLEGAWPKSASIPCDDEHLTQVHLHFDIERTEVRRLHSSGDRVAFSVRQHGTYRSGIFGMSAAADDFLDVNGMLRVADGEVVSGRIIRDRAGLWTRLMEAR